jgi:integrase
VVKHRAAILEARPFGALLRGFWDSDEIEPTTRAALKLCSLLAPRPGELRFAEWTEFDLEAGVWIVPAGRMKVRRPHASPLSTKSIAILRDLHELTGSTRLVFPGNRDRERPISDGTLIAALRRLGFAKETVSPHGFRASFSSFANESGKWHPDAIGRQLAHGDEDRIRGVYARSPFWAERVKLRQWENLLTSHRNALPGGSISSSIQQ